MWSRSCIHGVDRNPMAVELTKVALWIETVEPGKPLGFLDANIRCGDSLLGVFDLEVLAPGFRTPPTSRSPATTRTPPNTSTAAIRASATARARSTSAVGRTRCRRHRLSLRRCEPFVHLPEDSTAQISEKRRRLEAARAEAARENWRIGADLYMAAFLLPKKEIPRDDGAALVPTTDHLWRKLGRRTGLRPACGRHTRDSGASSALPLAFGISGHLRKGRIRSW